MQFSGLIDAPLLWTWFANYSLATKHITALSHTQSPAHQDTTSNHTRLDFFKFTVSVITQKTVSSSDWLSDLSLSRGAWEQRLQETTETVSPSTDIFYDQHKCGKWWTVFFFPSHTWQSSTSAPHTTLHGLSNSPNDQIDFDIKLVECPKVLSF